MAQPNSLLAYIPSRLLELLEGDPAPYPAPPWEHRLTGAVMFVDVSGFTPLSESLSRLGPAGTEQLTNILNRFYQWLVAGVEGAGGFVARFNGDAITAVLPGSDVSGALGEAIRCGLELIRTAYRHPPEVVDGMDFPLRVKVGVDAGPIYSATFGMVSGQLRYLVAGQPVKGASQATRYCQPMQLLVPKRLEEQLPDSIGALEAPGDHLLLMPSIFRRPAPVSKYHSLSTHPKTDLPRSRLARFVPSVIDERLQLGLPELLAEHRPVTVLFARFDGVDFDEESAGLKVQRFMAQVFELVAIHGGTVDKIEQADKGDLIMALFGAPRALERPEEAALNCALGMRMHFSEGEGPVITKIGINTGMVYAGTLGAPWRHDYTVLGHEVNLASRLTSSARVGEILIPDKVRARVPDWQFGPERSESIKGKSEPVTVWPVLGRHQVIREHDPDVIELPDRGDLLIGRSPEKEQLDRCIARLKSGHPGLVVLEGDLGVGKSRLADHVVEQVFGFGRVIHQRHRQSVRTPYGLWQWPLLELLGGPGQDLAERVRKLAHQVAPELETYLALLNPLLGTEFEVSSELEKAEFRARERWLFQLSSAMLLRFAKQTPLLLVLEDYQDADTASRALLRYVSERAAEVGAAIMLLVVARSGTPLPTPEFGPAFTHITLAPLGKEALLELVGKWANAEVAEPILELIWERSQGNPLFAEELLQTILDSDEVRMVEGRVEAGSLEAIAFPDSLRSLFQSRIDQIPEAGRVVAKVASVIGARFGLTTLAAGFREETPEAFLLVQLQQLIDARIIVESVHGSEPTYEFRQLLLREVIYNTLIQAQQAEIHRRVGLWLEKSDTLTSPGVLAHHFELGMEYARAISYHLEAAEQAYEVFANQEALAGFHRALALADEHWIPLPRELTRAQIMEAQGDVHFRIGAYKTAENIYRKVRTISSQWLGVVRALRKEGEARCRSDDVPNALRCAHEALVLLKADIGFTITGVGLPLLYRGVRDTLFRPSKPSRKVLPADERQRLVELDHVYRLLTLALQYEGQMQQIEATYRMAEVALRLGEPGRIARAYAAICYVYASLAMFRPSRKYARAALEWLRREPNEATRAQLRGNIAYALVGAASRLECDWAAAERHQQRCVTVNRATGDIWEEGLGLVNLATLWRLRGHHHKANEYHEQILALGSSKQRHLYMGEALVCKGLCLAELGQLDEASKCFDEALAHAGLNLLIHVRGVAYRGWMKYLSGRNRGALVDLDEAYRLIRSRQMTGEAIAEIQILRAEVLAATGARGLKMWWAMLQANRAGRKLPALKGALALVRGLIAQKRGYTYRARRYFSKAAFLHKKVDRGREAARALYWQASLQQKGAAGLRAEARKLLRDRKLPEELLASPRRRPSRRLKPGTRLS